MAGLLDFVKTPEGQGLLSAAFGGLAGARRGAPVNSLGRAGLAGLAGYSNAQDRIQQQDEAAVQKQYRDVQMQGLQAQMAKQKGEQEWRAGLSGMLQPQPQEIDQFTGTTQMVPPDPAKLQNYLMDPRSPFADKVLEQRLFPKADDFKVVGNSLVQAGPNGVKPVYTAPDKAEASPSSVREYEYAKANDGYKGTYQQFQTELKRAGASNVTVPINMGQKGFDNTLKLRGDFRSEPVYKAHQEMTSAYGQIQQSLKQASPAGDLAGATKIMKLLDPGSVVRESELGMAMAATGLLDRAQNYAQMVVSGQKLTPAQRQDFQKLADALYSESVTQYNGKRQEYQGIAERNQLSVPDVLGAESKVPTPAKPAAVGPFTDAAKEQRYQQWVESQKRGGK
jgi:hypothetical protein